MISAQERESASTSSLPISSRNFMVFAAILGAVFAWRILITVKVNLIPDECSYWTWSRYLDWSYFDNSGMVAYLIRLSTFFFGEHTPFTVRFPFLVLSALCTFLMYRLSCLLFGDRTRALAAVVGLNLAPLALLGGSAAMHDNALLFFWIAALWGAVRFVESENGRWFYFIGVMAGLAIQSKYTGVLVVPALLVFLIWSKPHRRWLARSEPWIGALIAGAFALPILWWNIKYDWASFYHILHIGSGAVSGTKKLTDGLEYHLAQFFIISPLLYVAMLAGIAGGFAATARQHKPAYALLICFSLPLVCFGIMSFRGHVEANWAVMGYPPAAILAVEVISQRRSEGKPGVWEWFTPRFLKWAAIVAVAPMAIVALHAWIGLLPAGIERKIAKEDRIIWETRGWDKLGTYVAGLAQPGDVIAADRYQMCALLEFNVPGQPEVRYLAPWRRPTAFDVRHPTYDDLAGKNIIFVTPEPLEPSSAVHSTIYENFGKVVPLPPYEVIYHGEAVRPIYLYRGIDFNPCKPRRLGPKSLFYHSY